ncbi:unnamed protein product [Amaranthus hypochondriacus]
MMRNGNGGLRSIQRLGYGSPSTTSTRRNIHFPIKCLSDFNDYAVLGLTPFASKTDVKYAYKRLALKYHPDVIRGDHVAEKHKMFVNIKSAYETLMRKFEEEEQMQTMQDNGDYDEWDEWMGFEGGIPATYHSY